MAPVIAGHLLAVVLAVLVGYWIAYGQWLMFVLLVGASVFGVLTLWMQKRVWLLIVFGWLLVGKLLLLRLPFSVRDLMVMLAFSSYIGYRVVSHRSVRAGWSLIDVLLVANLACVAFGLWLHPVGFYALGAQTVGARPYLNITFAVMGYWLLVHLPDSVKTVSRIPFYLLAVAVALGVLELMMIIFPSLVPHVILWYSEVDTSAYFSMMLGEAGIQRLKGLAPCGFYMMLVLCSYYPLDTLFDPRRGRFYALLIGFACILASGFRNDLAWAIAIVAIGGWLHNRGRELVIGVVAGATLVGALIFGQGRFYDLPLTVQRTLCFLPGEWSYEAARDAQNSSEWRFQLWKEIIDQGLIKDWWFGDGFGASAQALRPGAGGSVEDFIIESGGYHSGPLTAIRYAGCIGLVLLYMLSITAAIYSYKAVQRCRGTPLFGLAVFLAIQFIWGPIHYALLFGGYDSYLPDLIIQLGMLRLVMHFCDHGFVVPATSPRGVPATVPTAAGAPA